MFPGFLIPAVLLGVGYYQLSVGYLNTGRDLRRMESNTRSPIYSDFGELLEGIVTVRAFSAERRFLDNLHLKIDVTTKVNEVFHRGLFPFISRSLPSDVVFVLDDQQVASTEL